MPDVVKISEKDGFSWVEPLKEKMKNESIKSILLVAEKEITNGLLGLSNCLTKEPGGEKVRCVVKIKCLKAVKGFSESLTTIF